MLHPLKSLQAPQREVSSAKNVRHTEQQVANKKPKLSTDSSQRSVAQPAFRKPFVLRTDALSQPQNDAKPSRQVGDYDRPWRAYMKVPSSAEQPTAAEANVPAKNAVKPVTRSKALSQLHFWRYTTVLYSQFTVLQQTLLQPCTTSIMPI